MLILSLSIAHIFSCSLKDSQFWNSYSDTRWGGSIIFAGIFLLLSGTFLLKSIEFEQRDDVMEVRIYFQCLFLLVYTFGFGAFLKIAFCGTMTSAFLFSFSNRNTKPKFTPGFQNEKHRTSRPYSNAVLFMHQIWLMNQAHELMKSATCEFSKFGRMN